MQYDLNNANESLQARLDREVPVTHMNSIFGFVSVLVSAMAFGCAHAGSSDPSTSNEARSEGQSAVEEGGYGYEMLPLQLKADAVAPTGNSLMPNGRVAPEEVLRQATARIGALRTCYANAYAIDSTLSGEVRATYRFQANGELKSLQLQSDLALTPAFKDCLTAALNTMQMPATNNGPLQVEYPIALDPKLISTAN
jgi:hypothetical protein